MTTRVQPSSLCHQSVSLPFTELMLEVVTATAAAAWFSLRLWITLLKVELPTSFKAMVVICVSLQWRDEGVTPLDAVLAICWCVGGIGGIFWDTEVDDSGSLPPPPPLLRWEEGSEADWKHRSFRHFCSLEPKNDRFQEFEFGKNIRGRCTHSVCKLMSSSSLLLEFRNTRLMEET